MDIVQRPDDIVCVLYEGLGHWVATQLTYGGNRLITPRCTFKTHGASVMPLPMEYPTCLWCAKWWWV